MYAVKQQNQISAKNQQTKKAILCDEIIPIPPMLSRLWYQTNSINVGLSGVGKLIIIIILFNKINEININSCVQKTIK